MAVKLLIPTALRAFTDGYPEVAVEGKNVGDLIRALADAYPEIERHLFEEDGTLRSFVNIYIGDTNIKNLGGLETPIADGQTVMLVPAIAGGCCP
jgi:molybdopterin converting factor small subunit